MRKLKFNPNKKTENTLRNQDEIDFIDEELNKISIRRIKYFSLILIVLAVALLRFFDYPKYIAGLFRINQGYIHLTITHFAYITFSLIVFIIIVLKSKIQSFKIPNNVIITTYTSLCLLASLYGTYADLLIVGSIEIYLMGGFGMAIMMNIKPKTAFIMYLLYYISFVIAASTLNFYANQLLKYYFNSFIITLVCYFTSSSLYKIRVKELTRAILINNQTQELEKKNQELINLSEMKNNFVAMVNHDLKNVMGSLFSSTSYLLKRKLPNEFREYVELLNRTTKTLLQIAEDFLQVSLFESGKIKLNLSEVNFNEIIHEIINTYSVIQKNKNVNIKCNINCSIIVKIDKEKIYTVLRNLISHALKFTGEGKSIFIKCEQINGQIELHFIDNGPGKDENEIEHIFGFYKKKTNYDNDGLIASGLGLAICKKIIELHKGSISVKSKKGQGNDFCIKLPVSYKVIKKELVGN